MYLTLSFVAVGIYFCTRCLTRRKSSKLPPGPKTSWIPLVGNLFDMPTNVPWEVFHAWSKEFDSSIIQLNVAGASIVVLDTYEVALDLFEKRSSIYSSRPSFTMAIELMQWSFLFVGMPYGDSWRAHRKLFHQHYNPRASREFYPHNLQATHELLVDLWQDPDRFISHISHFTSKVIMSTTYGIVIKATNDPYVKMAEDAFKTLNLAAQPGAYLVDALPLLKYVPSWFPGAKFQRDAKEWAKLARAFARTPFEATKRSIAEGNASVSFTSKSLSEIPDGPDAERLIQEEIVHNVAATTWGATVDTTSAALTTFVMAMVLHPDVARKAQKDLDNKLLLGELPTFDDYSASSFPYVDAIVKEVLRWRPPAPLGVPHLLESDDIYDEYRIPAQSVVIGNIWAMLHDEKHYPSPHAFNPDRFMNLKENTLDQSVRDPDHAVFGFGRRSCPGRHTAYASLWIVIASILRVFDIQPALDEDGAAIEPSSRYDTTGIVSHPIPFPCTIKPRSTDVELTLQRLQSCK